MKYLFVDDEPYRHKSFERMAAGHVVHYAYSIDEAQRLLQNEEYDVAFLDHDLEDIHYKITHGDYTQEVLPRSGADLAKWMVENDLVPPAVVIHSMNKSGSDNIKGILEGKTILTQVPFHLLEDALKRANG